MIMRKQGCNARSFSRVHEDLRLERWFFDTFTAA